MKKILVFISLVGLTACDYYTVENKSGSAIKVGDMTVEDGKCVELSDGLFGFGLLFGDFPVSITKADEASSQIGDQEEYSASNYTVSATSVAEADEACEVKDEDDGDADAGADASGSDAGAGSDASGSDASGADAGAGASGAGAEAPATTATGSAGSGS